MDSPRHKDILFNTFIIVLLTLTLASVYILLYNTHIDRIQRQLEIEDTRQMIDIMLREVKESREFREGVEQWLDKLNVGEFEASAYAPLDPDAVEGMCYIGDPRVTATGARTTPGRTIAVDPDVIPMGTRVYIPGVGVRVAEDRGGLIRGNRLDLCMSSRAAALDYGRRRVMAVWLKPHYAN
jgi:3D (Asp-Asp-Asp) domain-containing protein